MLLWSREYTDLKACGSPGVSRLFGALTARDFPEVGLLVHFLARYLT